MPPHVLAVVTHLFKSRIDALLVGLATTRLDLAAVEEHAYDGEDEHRKPARNHEPAYGDEGL